MGCDIHIWVERRDGGPWVFVPRFTESWRDKYPVDTNMTDGLLYRLGHWYDDRNYRLFDALTGTRCQAMHSGIKDGKWWYTIDPDYEHTHNIIGELRSPGTDDGLGSSAPWPDDLSPELKALREGIEHTPCWATLDELEDERIAKEGGESWIEFIRTLNGLVEDGMSKTDVRVLWYYDS